jgi:hypothetical protein
LRKSRNKIEDHQVDNRKLVTALRIDRGNPPDPTVSRRHELAGENVVGGFRPAGSSAIHASLAFVSLAHPSPQKAAPEGYIHAYRLKQAPDDAVAIALAQQDHVVMTLVPAGTGALIAAFPSIIRFAK